MEREVPRPVLPKTFLDDEPILIGVEDDGFTISVPYIHEATSETKYKVKTCFGIGEVCFHLETLVKEILALREKEKD